jgi:hypothetical protein
MKDYDYRAETPVGHSATFNDFIHCLKWFKNLCEWGKTDFMSVQYNHHYIAEVSMKNGNVVVTFIGE